MFLVADSGSTNTQWRLIDNNSLIKRFESIGLNPYHIKRAEIKKNILKSGYNVDEFKKEVKNIFFYGSGCLNASNRKILEKELQAVFINANIEVYSDLLGAGRALFKKGDGIVAILGTGAGSCYFDGNDIAEKIPSLGYILGDEGSGTYFGLVFLKAYLNNELPPALSDVFKQKYKLNHNDILECVYRNPFPNKYLAQFSVFLKENEEHSYIQDLLYKGFQEFLEKSILKYKDCRKKKIGFVGSIAYYFRHILVEVAKYNHLDVGVILKDPMDELVNYHQKMVIK